MPSPRSLILGCIVACGVLLAQPRAWAFIQKLFPLQEFIDDSDFLFTATVENDTIKLPPGVHLPDGTEVRIEPQTLPGRSVAEPRKFITRTHDFGFKPGIDLTKLGQLADEL